MVIVWPAGLVDDRHTAWWLVVECPAGLENGAGVNGFCMDCKSGGPSVYSLQVCLMVLHMACMSGGWLVNGLQI